MRTDSIIRRRTPQRRPLPRDRTRTTHRTVLPLRTQTVGIPRRLRSKPRMPGRRQRDMLGVEPTPHRHRRTKAEAHTRTETARLPHRRTLQYQLYTLAILPRQLLQRRQQHHRRLLRPRLPLMRARHGEARQADIPDRPRHHGRQARTGILHRRLPPQLPRSTGSRHTHHARPRRHTMDRPPAAAPLPRPNRNRHRHARRCRHRQLRRRTPRTPVCPEPTQGRSRKTGTQDHGNHLRPPSTHTAAARIQTLLHHHPEGEGGPTPRTGHRRRAHIPLHRRPRRHHSKGVPAADAQRHPRREATTPRLRQPLR